MPRARADFIDRLPALFWVCVFGAAAVLAVDTATTIQGVGLVGERPPLSAASTALRIVLLLSSLGLALVRRDVFERLTLLTAAAAAGSSALFGFGLRSNGLSAFRLLSHLAMYVFVMIVAGRMVLRARAPGERALVWWVPVLLIVHNAEEARAFPSYLPRLPFLLPEPIAAFEARLSYPTLLIALAVLSIAGLLVAAAVHRRPASAAAMWLLVSLEAAVALNVIAHVMTAALVFHGYGPGLITAVTINAPFAIYFFRRASREQWVSPQALWATLPMALFLHGPVLFGALWLATQ